MMNYWSQTVMIMFSGQRIILLSQLGKSILPIYIQMNLDGLAEHFFFHANNPMFDDEYEIPLNSKMILWNLFVCVFLKI
jgi:hypothetical protein